MGNENKPAIPYLVEHVWPAHRIHLIGGAPDAGKTRFILPALLALNSGQPVLGKPSRPVPWAYAIGDRLLVEAEDTIRDMGYSPDNFRLIPAFGAHNKGWLQIVMEASRLDPRPELLVVEGFQDLPEGDSKAAVREFLCRVAAYCQPCRDFPSGLTVMGICESPKMKPKEQYHNPRQRISGVSSWAYHSSTVILIEAVKGDNEFTTGDRTVWVCPKNHPRRKLAASFDERGRLQVVDN